MGMSISGLTGYDWSSVIDGLVNVEKQQLTALETQKEKNTAKSDIYGQLSTYMTAVSDAAYNLRYLGGNALGQISAESSNTSVATLKASSGVTSLAATLNVSPDTSRTQ